MLNGLKVRQIAYYVKDIHKAAEHHNALYGSGPYYFFRDATFQINYRGQERELTHSAAFGQWGAMQVEFLSSAESGPSLFHDLYPASSGRWGLHHVAVIADDFDAAIAAAQAAGCPVVQDAEIKSMDLRIAMADTVEKYGHFLEIYSGGPGITEFYDMIENAAQDWDGKELFREMQL